MNQVIAVGQQTTRCDVFGLVFNQAEPFWLAQWLNGFGGKVFAEDGKTPTLVGREVQVQDHAQGE